MNNLLTKGPSIMQGSEKTKRRTPNALIKEKSPYLLQHAYNPVNWCPWGKEEFARASEENKPIFLSIEAVQ